MLQNVHFNLQIAAKFFGFLRGIYSYVLYIPIIIL